MVTVPAGPFMQGCNQGVDSDCWDNEKPSFQVTVPAFAVDQYLVTVDLYGYCVSAGVCSEPKRTWSDNSMYNWDNPNHRDHPVNNITWYQARQFCAWAGKRLCSESEWEKAARGTDGRIYPWGNEDPLSAQSKYGGPVGNFADDTAKTVHGGWTVIAGYDDGYVNTSPVGQFPLGVSPYGAMDMAGNVWEWVEDDWHDSYSGASGTGGPWNDDPRATERVVRGGSYSANKPSYLRASYRDIGSPDLGYDFGFRCCKDAL